MVKKKNSIVIPIELTKEEQEFVGLLTDKLIEVAQNPSMRKDFIIQASATVQFRFYKEDIPSEIENKALLLFNIVNNNYERALLWAEQVQDELIKHQMLATYYRCYALDAPQDADETQSLYLQSLEHAFQSVYGISCGQLEEYAEYLMKSYNEVNLLELTILVFAVGVHRINPTDPDALLIFNQERTRDEVEMIQRMLQIIREYAENGREEAKEIFMNYYHWESAYYYACTGRIEKFKEEMAMLSNDYKELNSLFDFSNLTEQEREERHNDLNEKIADLIGSLLEDDSLHFQQMLNYVNLAFGYEACPKRTRPQKGSFDYLYNAAEKGYIASRKNKATEKDYQYMCDLANAYRTGNGVRQNLRLADCWEEMAKH